MIFAELVPHYHAASVFAFPSVCEETCPLPPIEAMASSLPVVATRDGALPELVEHGRTGLLVERSNAQALADAILELLNDPDRRHAMADRLSSELRLGSRGIGSSKTFSRSINAF